LCIRSGEEDHDKESLLASLHFKVASQVCQRRRLDQQTLSFVAVTTSAEAHDNNACRAFHLPRRDSGVSPAGKNSGSSRPTQARHAGPGFSIISRSPLPLYLWHFHSLFNGRITTSTLQGSRRWSIRIQEVAVPRITTHR
jgi:hypothetical protein